MIIDMNPERYLTQICELLFVDVQEIKSKSRTAPLPDYRKIISWVMWMRGYKQHQIATAIGYREHSTVCMNINKVNYRKYLNQEAHEVLEILNKN